MRKRQRKKKDSNIYPMLIWHDDQLGLSVWEDRMTRHVYNVPSGIIEEAVFMHTLTTVTE